MNRYIHFRWYYRVLFTCVTGTLIAIGLLVSPVNALRFPTAAPDFSAIDTYLRSEMRKARLPGLAIGIVQGDELLYLKGYGDNGHGQAVTPQMPFQIGSIGKSFTALAIMQLVEAGKVELDAPVQRYIPWFTLADPDAAAHITVRHLLHHTTGIPTPAGLRAIEPDDRDQALEDRVRMLSSVFPSQPPGKIFQYSNSNYEILGLIVQLVAGQPFEDYLADHILKPLEMRHSYFSPLEAQKDNGSAGHQFWFGFPVRYDFPYNRGLMPSGTWWSSAEDLSHYLIAQLRAGHYGNATILSEAGVEALHQPAFPTSGGPIESGEWYGMGWFIRQADDLITISHAGTNSNFHANLVMVPDSQWGIVILMNGENGLQPERISRMALDVTTLLIGRAPWEIGPSDFYRTMFSYVLIGILIQTLGMGRSFALLRRWRDRPEQRPRDRLRIALRILPSLVVNVAWVILLTAVSKLAGGSLTTLRIFVPDLAFLIILSGGTALVWAVLRPILMLRLLRVDGAQAQPVMQQI